MPDQVPWIPQSSPSERIWAFCSAFNLIQENMHYFTVASDIVLYFSFRHAGLRYRKWLKITQPTDWTDLLSEHICLTLHTWNQRVGAFTQEGDAFHRSLGLKGLDIAYNTFCMPLKYLECRSLVAVPRASSANVFYTESCHHMRGGFLTNWKWWQRIVKKCEKSPPAAVNLLTDVTTPNKRLPDELPVYYPQVINTPIYTIGQIKLKWRGLLFVKEQGPVL